MEENYYVKTLNEAKDLVKKEEYFKAMRIIEDELSMPYIPEDFEKELLSLKKAIDRSLKKDRLDLSDEMLKEYLFNDPVKELIAVNALSKKNLRDYLKLVQEYLLSKGDDKAKTLLIAALVDQEIKEELKVLKNGMEISFIPKYVESIEYSDGYIRGREYLRKELENDDPIMYKMALELLGNKVFSSLPLSVDEDEGVLYAKALILYLDEALFKNAEKEAFLKKEVSQKEVEVLKTIIEDLKSA